MCLDLVIFVAHVMESEAKTFTINSNKVSSLQGSLVKYYLRRACVVCVHEQKKI